jgi:hypothetical protein
MGLTRQASADIGLSPFDRFCTRISRIENRAAWYQDQYDEYYRQLSNSGHQLKGDTMMAYLDLLHLQDDLAIGYWDPNDLLHYAECSWPCLIDMIDVPDYLDAVNLVLIPIIMTDFQWALYIVEITRRVNQRGFSITMKFYDPLSGAGKEYSKAKVRDTGVNLIINYFIKKGARFSNLQGHGLSPILTDPNNSGVVVLANPNLERL